jgi:hypothetical protein
LSGASARRVLGPSKSRSNTPAERFFRNRDAVFAFDKQEVFATEN